MHLAAHVADQPPKPHAHKFQLPPRALLLFRVQVTPRFHRRVPRHAHVGLPQTQPGLLRLLAQLLDRRQQQPVFGRMRDRFFLHRRVHRHRFGRAHAQRSCAIRRRERLLQQRLQRLVPHAMAKMRQPRPLQRKRVLKIFLPAKILHVRIPLPSRAHRFIRQPLDVLQQMQPHQQPDR